MKTTAACGGSGDGVIDACSATRRAALKPTAFSDGWSTCGRMPRNAPYNANPNALLLGGVRICFLLEKICVGGDRFAQSREKLTLLHFKMAADEI
ncbi:MAG: hypothetical protein U0L91_04465 [Gemmiger sp.]|uniref:hypothetical protein n=1 Tax=Gemmiger sp. TaxID=2049027 RepID=UPI002E7A50FB|nr:hypothetical protein [Gemmiger sp.]MEE0800514.1 hypothetical protein [Gemmiger sp.]